MLSYPSTRDERAVIITLMIPDSPVVSIHNKRIISALTFHQIVVFRDLFRGTGLLNLSQKRINEGTCRFVHISLRESVNSLVGQNPQLKHKQYEQQLVALLDKENALDADCCVSIAYIVVGAQVRDKQG
jgi:hypothetical protein